MASTKVIIYDPTGSKKTPVELPADVPMRRLIPALVTKMGLPTNQGANPITYRLDHRTSGKRLSDDESLQDAGVKEDDILSLFPEVTAGACYQFACLRVCEFVRTHRFLPLAHSPTRVQDCDMTFDIRETRLRNDYKRVRELVERSELIHILTTDGDPPERYHIRFTCRGVENINADKPVYRDVHEVSLYLHAEYPLKQPQMKWLTPIFHPNIHITG